MTLQYPGAAMFRRMGDQIPTTRPRPLLMAMLLLLVCGGLAGPGYLNAETKARPAAAGADPLPASCIFPGLALPPETEVYAVDGRVGRPLGWSIDYDQGRDPTLIKVAVNSPQAPVALILGAYEPNVWQIGWTEGTEIMAVAVIGQYRQAVSGLPPEVPVAMGGWSGEPGRNAFCGLVDFSNRSNSVRLNEVSRRLFGRKFTGLVRSGNSRIVIGQILKSDTKVMTSRNLASGDFKTPSDSPEGEAGLTEALRRGLIKPATWVELRQWRRAAFEREKREAEAEGRTLPAVFDNTGGGSGAEYLIKGFLVVSPDFVVPDRLKLSGNIMFNFFVPPGMDRPAGPLGKQTRLLFMADGTELSGSPARPGRK